MPSLFFGPDVHGIGAGQEVEIDVQFPSFFHSVLTRSLIQQPVASGDIVTRVVANGQEIAWGTFSGNQGSVGVFYNGPAKVYVKNNRTSDWLISVEGYAY